MQFQNNITFKAIGIVQNEFKEPTSAKRASGAEIKESESRIVLNPDLEEGLLGLESGDQLMIIFHFHLSKGFDLHQHPRGDPSRDKRGVFALRSPRRPNPIGVTVVELLGIKGNVLRVWGLDAIDGTPVLDLKPA
jgi:tRNA-Thr(GGU) m(6)t(6)A37 methyltransferase TsaA